MSGEGNYHFAEILRNSTENFVKVKASRESFVKIADNTWLQLGKKLIGLGTFGAVYAAKNKITLLKEGITETPIDNVVKVQSCACNRESIIADIENEVDYLNGHGVQAQLVECSDKALVVMDNCGVSLGSKLPFAAFTPFTERVVFAKGIINEMLLLKKNDVVHCDLKLRNICYKQLENGALQFFFIDFGSAIAAGAKRNFLAGTNVYIAPEIFVEGGGNSFSSDLYALAAILGCIFGAENIFKFKKAVYGQEYKKEYLCLVQKGFNRSEAKKIAIAKACEEISKKPFNFDGLGEGVESIDEGFKKDLLQLLKELSAANPDLRPSLEFVLKFFNHIPYRKQDFETFKKDQAKLIQLQQACERLAGELGLLANNKLPTSDVLVQDVSYYKTLKEITESKSSVAEIDSAFPILKDEIAKLEKKLKKLKGRKGIYNWIFFRERTDQLPANGPRECPNTLTTVCKA